MESLYILIPIAMLFVAIAVAIFFWAVKSGQFEDLDAEGKRILFDEFEQNAPASKRDKIITDSMQEKQDAGKAKR